MGSSSVFEVLEMENFQGDLTDVVRGIGGHVSPPTSILPLPPPLDHLHTNPFGDPFVTMNDPLLHQELTSVTNSSYFSTVGDNNNNNINSNNNGFLSSKIFEEDHIKSQCNIFPRIRISHSNNNIIQDSSSSPCNSPAMSAARAVAAAAVASPRGIINVDTNSPRNCVLVDGINTFSSQIQISSPRNLGLKRRKSQAKKVVCIPAPAAMNSRSSGEVVPSDLWAWRKYGQKPIKGSPFPRGYYRCSSSKGCSARKQVERSRTDPNMLVITYTSEHNHPWPIQRNALAGSTRSSSSSSSNPNPSKSTTTNTMAASSSPKPSSATPSPLAASAVKDEQREDDMELENVEEDDHNNQILAYRPDLHHHHHNHQPEDFFADLEELEGDSLSMLLSRGCAGDEELKTTSSEGIGDFFGWSGDDNNNNNDHNNLRSL